MTTAISVSSCSSSKALFHQIYQEINHSWCRLDSLVVQKEKYWSKTNHFDCSENKPKSFSDLVMLSCWTCQNFPYNQTVNVRKSLTIIWNSAYKTLKIGNQYKGRQPAHLNKKIDGGRHREWEREFFSLHQILKIFSLLNKDK